MKLVILDRDGVINFDSDKLIKSPEEWRPIPGSLEAIARLNQDGYHVVVATNQSGPRAVRNGRSTPSTEMMKWWRSGRIDSIFFARILTRPAMPQAAPGHAREIAVRYSTDLSGVPAVGDSLRDLQAAVAMGAQPILVLTGKGAKTHDHPDLPRETLVFPDLAAAAAHIAA